MWITLVIIPRYNLRHFKNKHHEFAYLRPLTSEFPRFSCALANPATTKTPSFIFVSLNYTLHFENLSKSPNWNFWAFRRLMKVNLGLARFWWREHDDVGRGRNGGKGWNFQNPKNRRRITNCKLVQTAQLGSCEQKNVKQLFCS